MIEISRTYAIQAAHQLPNVPEGHKCGRVHGHTWVVEITVRGEPDPTSGWFMDFADLDVVFRERVLDVIDHRSLNDFIPNPTTENLCMWLSNALHLPGLCRITARENSRSCVVMHLEPEREETSMPCDSTGGD